MILEVIEDKMTGIITILDDELRIPQSSDQRLLEKIDQANKDKKEAFYKDYRKIDTFTIMHFAGDVDYNILGFVEKNKDQSSGNMKAVMQNSNIELVQQLFPDTEDTKNKAQRSLAYQFRKQLNSLMKTLEDTNPFYIKCIKPNHHKSPDEFDPMLVLDQLKSTRIVESLEIVQKGFPYRLKYQDFAARYKVVNPNYTGTNWKKATELILKKLNYDTNRFKLGYNFVHFRSEDNKFIEAQRNLSIDKLIIKVQNAVRKRQAKALYRELRKYKQLCLAALEDGTLPVVEAALKKGENLKFIIKEHKQLKNLEFKLKEELELQRELEELAKLKGAQNLDKMENLVQRADKVGFNNQEMARLKEIYEKEREIKKIQDTLLKAIDSFMDIEALRAALDRARELGTIPTELIEKAQLILERYQREIDLFRQVLQAFTIGCPTDFTQGPQQVEYSHIDPLLQQFRMVQPFYNQQEFPQHLYEFEIMFGMRAAVKSEDFNQMQAYLIKTNDIFMNEHFHTEVNIMKQVVAHFGEVEKIKATVWTAIDTMDLNTIRYCMDQGEIYGINWETVVRPDDGVHQAVTMSSIFNSVISEATVAVNVMEREIMKRWYDTLCAFKLHNEVYQALKYLLEEVDKVKFDQLAYKAAMFLKDEKLIIWRTIKMKEFEFVGDVNMSKWVLSSCHLLKDPDDWAAGGGFFKSKKDLSRGFYLYTKKSIHESLTKNLNKIQNKLAVQTFKNLLGYSGEKSVPYPYMSGVKVLETGIKNADLRDEIYAQILKQLLKNTEEVSKLRMEKFLIL